MTLRAPPPAGIARATGFTTGVLVMAYLVWHVAVHWNDIYAQFPLSSTGMSPATMSEQPPDYVMSSLSLRLAQYLMGMAAFLLALALPGRVRLMATTLLAGASLPPALFLFATPGAFTSSLGPFAVVLNLMFSAGVLGIGVLAGAVPGALVNAVRRR